MSQKDTGSEFKGIYHDTPGTGEQPESTADINEHYRQRLNDAIERAKTYPAVDAKNGSAANAANTVTESLEIGEVGGQRLSLHFFIYTPEEQPLHHRPYSPSINATYRLEATPTLPARVDRMVHLEQSDLDSSNSRFDEAKVLAAFEGLELAFGIYESLLKAKSGA